MEREVVYLDDMEGFEFERLVGRILQSAGLGQVENVRDTGDEGRDLLVHGPSGLIVVECKHQPKSSIGRPVVQKLHSAVISSSAIRGMLVISGKFSAQAVSHAAKLYPPIELVDLAGLAALAARAGIVLYMEGETMRPLIPRLTVGEEFFQRICQLFDLNFESRPALPSTQLALERREVSLVPCYLIRYSVDAIFKTSVGVIHREAVPDGIAIFNASTGRMLQSRIADHLRGARLTEFDAHDLKVPPPAEDVRILDRATARTTAKSYISLSHQRLVSYTGLNNVSYQKLCQPKESDILISDVKQVYLPISRTTTRTKARVRDLQVVENDSPSLLVLDEMPWTCDVCGASAARARMLLCQECGAGAHPPEERRGHGFRCSSCGMTACRRCSRYVRRYIVLKKPVCPSCARRLHASGEANPKPFPPLSGR